MGVWGFSRGPRILEAETLFVERILEPKWGTLFAVPPKPSLEAGDTSVKIESEVLVLLPGGWRTERG